MITTDLKKARRELQESGGVLLDLGGEPRMYEVCSFSMAVDARWEDAPYDMAAYWCKLAEAGYDETTPVFRKWKALTT